MEIVPLGDSTLVGSRRNRFQQTILRISRKCPRYIAAFAGRRKIPGVVDLTSAYTTIAVFFDPVRVVEAGAPVASVIDWLTAKIQAALQKGSKRKQKKAQSRLLEIPVCYEDEFGFDLADVAQHADVSVEEVIRVHTRHDYRVACVGFTPGFGFLSGLDPKLVTPRRSTPRTSVPAGSVAIGGAQTGVYPIRSPGGWNVIGRTPLRMFDVRRDPPALLCAGDRVRFRNITREEFENLKA